MSKQRVKMYFEMSREQYDKLKNLSETKWLSPQNLVRSIVAESLEQC